MSGKTHQKPVARRKPKPQRKPALPARSASPDTALAQRSPSTALARMQKLPDKIEALLLQGDLTQLSVPERMTYYKAVCRSIGVNPLTRPFEYIVFTDREQDEDADPNAKPQGKMILYARADCAAQLRKKHRVGIRGVSRRREGDFFTVEVEAFIHERAGTRTDSATGIVWLKRWKGKYPNKKLADIEGRELANAMMKAETKAKRRATFSICGLHILDESDLEDLTNITYDVTEGGRVVNVVPGPGDAEKQSNVSPAELTDRYELAVYMVQRDPFDKGSFKERVDAKLQELKRNTPEQIAYLLTKYREPGMQTPEVQPAAATSAKVQPAAATPKPTPAPEVDNYPGITIRAIEGGKLFRIEGLQSTLREHREHLTKFWKPNAKPPALLCTPEEGGKLMSTLEKAKIQYRLR